MIAQAVAVVAGVLSAAAVVTASVGLSSGGPPVAPLVDAACEGRLVLRTGAGVRSADLDEVSGVVESRLRRGVLWMHNDSGGAARVYAIGSSGRTLGEFTLAAGENVDWEDIAAGPGPLAGRDYLYVGDIGDNDRVRDTISVLRLLEPALGPGGPVTGTVDDVDRLVLRYPDGAHDAETLLVDPRSGDIVVVTKAFDGRSRVYRSPGGRADGSTTTLRRVATLRLGLAVLVTGGDVSRSGAVVALRTYGSVLLYARPPGRPLWAAFAGRRCSGVAPPEVQGEAIALRGGGRSYVTVAEGAHPRIYRVVIRRR